MRGVREREKERERESSQMTLLKLTREFKWRTSQ